MCYWHLLMPENRELGTSWVSNDIAIIEKNDSSARTSTKKYSQRTRFYCSTLPKLTSVHVKKQKKHWHGIESPRLVRRLVTWSTFSFPMFAYVCAVLPLQQVLLISGRFPGVLKKPLMNITEYIWFCNLIFRFRFPIPWGKLLQFLLPDSIARLCCEAPNHNVQPEIYP